MRASTPIAVLCASAAFLSGSAASQSGTGAEVTIPGKLFAPRDLDVLVGTTVTWQNADTATHTVTQDDDAFDSGHVRPGGAFAEAFAESGTFPYHCTIHRFMRGTVRVFQVVLRGPPEPLAAGKRAQLDGVAPAGTTEVVLERVVPGPATILGQVKVGVEGTFSFRVPAPEPRAYRVRAGSATSPLVRVRVAPRVEIARRGSALVVVARPARPGSRVLIERYDRELFAFVPVIRARLDSSSRATIAYVPRGREHVRAVVRGSAGWSDGFSRPLVVSRPS